MSLATLVQSLTEFAEEVERGYGAGEEEPSAETLAIVLTAVRECRSGLATVYDRIEADLLALMGERSMTVPGLGLVEAKKKKSYKRWDNDELARKVIALAYDERLLDETTGEYEREGDAIARVLLECERPSWRLTPLRARGIDETEFCEVVEEGWQIKLPARTLA